MQTPSGAFLRSIGELIRAKRAIRMDQQELALRVGISRATISSMERGAGVNSNSLFKVLHHLDLLHDLQHLVDAELDSMDNSFSRKSRKVKEVLSNDF
jgi:transcriptional regulator with XRE-family HTH domain